MDGEEAAGAAGASSSERRLASAAMAALVAAFLATAMGAFPSSLRSVRLAPALRRAFKISCTPSSAALCRGVAAWLFLASTSAPASSRMFVTLACPSATALCKAVPSASRRSSSCCSRPACRTLVTRRGDPLRTAAYKRDRSYVRGERAACCCCEGEGVFCASCCCCCCSREDDEEDVEGEELEVVFWWEDDDDGRISLLSFFF